MSQPVAKPKVKVVITILQEEDDMSISAESFPAPAKGAEPEPAHVLATIGINAMDNFLQAHKAQEGLNVDKRSPVQPVADPTGH